MRVVFMGTPDFSVPTLTEIVSSGHEVVAVYTRAPKPAGRGQAERKSPVHLAAEGFGIPVFTPRSLKGATEQGVFALHDADVAIVVAYGLLLPKPILERSAPRVPQSAWLAAAALARCCADPARHHGRRPADRRHGDADG